MAEDLRALPAKDAHRILKCFEQPAENPRPPGCEKLSGQERYRLCQGICRIVYEIRDDVLKVVVVKIGHGALATNH
ncbi:MAG: type II toxin-antitoxin system RelE family toxin [Syntrophaceae bacterium]